MHPLDNPIWFALIGPHARFAIARGPVRRYPPDMAFFGAAEDIDDRARRALAELARDEPVIVARRDAPRLDAEPDHTVRTGHQYVFDDDAPIADEAPAGVERLDARDVAAMTELVALTQPGPFRPRTIELGDYYGVRDGDQLVAMAGERMHLDGWCEISAVCTHPDARRRGLAARLTLAVAHGIRARGERPFLHVAEGNDAARALYESIGMRHRADLRFGVVTATQCDV